MSFELKSDYVYLDWAASAPLSQEAADAMACFLRPGRENYACNMNANSLHRPGRAAFTALEEARRDMAQLLGCTRPNEFIFTSGATESNNLAVCGLARGIRALKKSQAKPHEKWRIITSKIEHDSVLEPARALKEEGFELVELPVTRQGFVEKESFSKALNEHTILASIQLANSEIGSIQDIKELAACAHKKGVLFHSDTTQALGKIPVRLDELGVDAASFSSHKIGGPKGVGALYLKNRLSLKPIILGGGQEDARRSGTQNVAGIVGFAAALKSVLSHLETESKRQSDLRDFIYKEASAIKGIIPTIDVRAFKDGYLANIVHLLVANIESETLILQLDKAGFGVSGGSACASHSLEPSHVLSACSISRDDAYGALRISLGALTTKEDIVRFIDALKLCVSRL